MKNVFTKGKYSLLLLFLVGFLIRVWHVNNYPPLLWDEAALGYNAYSILQTGRDEYGKSMPLIFKSFGDYKPGLYVYLAVPFVAVLGLSELAVRLPSVLFGALMPIFLYFLVEKIFGDRKLALWSAFTLIFLPWAIHFSRGSWEANVMTGFLLLGSYFLIKGERFIVLGLATFLLALLTYQGAKMMVPLILLGLAYCFNNKLEINFSWFKNWIIKFRRSVENKPFLFIGASIIIILMIGWYWQSFSGPAANRLKVMSLFSYHRPQAEVQKLLAADGLSHKNWRFYLFHEEWLADSRAFLDRYFNYFSPRFLAFSGDWSNTRHSAPYFGMVGHINCLLFLLGLVIFLSKKHKGKEYFFLYWLAVAPLPAALSRDVTSGVRSLPMIIPISVFIGIGLKGILEFKLKLKSIKIQFIVQYAKYATLALLLFFNFAYWADLYFVHMVKKSPKDWLYGYKQVMGYISKKHGDVDKTLVTDFYGQPYIYYLFYSKYSPRRYQREAELVENKFGDVGKVEKIGDISFGPVNGALIKSCRNCLLIFSQDEILRSGIDRNLQLFAKLRPLGKIGRQAMFYAWQTDAAGNKNE